jgi:hypothetical protein
MLKLIKFVKNDNPQRESLKGHVLIDVHGKMFMWFAIIQTKTNQVFSQPITFFLEGKWEKSVILQDTEKHKTLCRDVLELVNNGGYLSDS